MGHEPPAVLEAITDVLRDAMDEWRVPGAALGVSSLAAESHEFVGTTNIEHPLPITAETVFQVGSISKVFTATAIMRLCETNDLDLDEPIRRWLPELNLRDREATAGVTLRHLMEHTGGWFGDYDVDTGRGEDALRKLLPVIESARQATPLGRHYHYNNLGFALAGLVIEAATGAPFERAVEALVIQPAALGNTSFFPEQVIFKRLAAGHISDRNGTRLTEYSRPRARVANGGVLSCLADVLHFGRIHLRLGEADNGAVLLTEASARAMQVPSAVTGVDNEHRGIGWGVSTRYGLKLLEHGGSTPGFQAQLWVWPDEALVVALLTNASTGGGVIWQVHQALLTSFAGGDIPLARAAISEAEFEELRGYYMGGGVLEIGGSADAPMLATWLGSMFDPATQAIARTNTEDRFEVTDGLFSGTQFDLLRAPDGRIEFLRYSGSRLFKRVSAARHVERLEPVVELHAEFAPHLAALKKVYA